MKKVYLGSLFLFKQVSLNKIESLLFWSFFFFLSRILMFSFNVTILKFIDGSCQNHYQGNIYAICKLKLFSI